MYLYSYTIHNMTNYNNIKSRNRGKVICNQMKLIKIEKQVCTMIFYLKYLVNYNY